MNAQSICVGSRDGGRESGTEKALEEGYRLDGGIKVR